MLHPFVVLRQFGFLAFCNGSSLETSHCGFQDCTANNPYMLEHLEPCPNKLRCGAYIHHKSFCSQPYFQCVQSYTSRAIVLFIHSHDELFQDSATIYAKHHDAILCCFRMMPCFVVSKVSTFFFRVGSRSVGMWCILRKALHVVVPRSMEVYGASQVVDMIGHDWWD